jgi:hypothetical protein
MPDSSTVTRRDRRTEPRTRSARSLALLVALAALALAACRPVPQALAGTGTGSGSTGSSGGTEAAGTTPTARPPARVALFGDSVPHWMVRDGAAGIDTARFALVDATIAACDGAAENPPVRSRTGSIVPTPTSCAPGWPTTYPPALATPADVAIVATGVHAMLDRRLDGVWRHPCSAQAAAWYRADLEGRLRLLAQRSARTVLVLPAWPGDKSGWIMPTDRAARADCVRSTMRAAATATNAVVVDLASLLCPGGAAGCTTWRSVDGIHLDPDRADDALAWLLAAAAPPFAAGTHPGRDAAPTTPTSR